MLQVQLSSHAGQQVPDATHFGAAEVGSHEAAPDEKMIMTGNGADGGVNDMTLASTTSTV